VIMSDAEEIAELKKQIAQMRLEMEAAQMKAKEAAQKKAKMRLETEAALKKAREAIEGTGLSSDSATFSLGFW